MPSTGALVGRAAAFVLAVGMVGGCSSEGSSGQTTTTARAATTSTTVASTTTTTTIPGSDIPPIYQSAEEIVALLDGSPFACSDVEITRDGAVLALQFTGLVETADCEDGFSSNPELTGYHVLVFDSEPNRRSFAVGVLGWACMETPTFPYVYGPNWLLLPSDDRTPLEPVEQASELVSGTATAVDCRVFYDFPDDLDPSNPDMVWFRAATGEVEFPALSADLFPETPPVPLATGLSTSAPNDGVVVDGLLVAVGDGTLVVWQLPDPGAVDITGSVFDDWLRRIVAIPDGFVAVGFNRGAAISSYSTDGATWDTTELQGGGSATAVASGPVGLIAVGENDDPGPMLWRSADGRAWEVYDPADTTGTPLEVVVDFHEALRGLNDVVASERGYVVVNSTISQARIWFSEDLVTWSAAKDFDGSVHDIVAHEDRFVALVGSGDEPSGIWVSEDGLTWFQAAPPDQLELSHPGGSKRALASSPKGVLAITYNNRIAVSPDGLAWTPIETPGILKDVWLPTIVGGPDGWYLFGRLGIGTDAWGIFFSDDATHWTRVGGD